MSDTDSRLDALEARLRELEDREEIRDVIVRYGFTADLGFDREYVDQYVEDGEYDIGRTVYRGHDELYEFISSPEGSHKTNVEGRGSQHTSVNIMIRTDGDTAWAECYSIVFVRESAESFGIWTAAYNHWDFRRVDGKWRIVRRRRTPIGSNLHEGATPGRDIIKNFLTT